MKNIIKNSFRFVWSFFASVVLQLLTLFFTNTVIREYNVFVNAFFWLSVVLLFLSILVSISEFTVKFIENGRKQSKYAFHWVSIFALNLVGPVYFYNDTVIMAYTMSFTLIITSFINSLPIFDDILEAKNQIYENWKFEDFLFFRGHFSKNMPSANRNPIHALWPILLVASLSVSVYGILCEKSPKVAAITFIQDAGRTPTSIQEKDTESNSVDYKILKGILILSASAAGLFIIYSHAFKSDYSKKWEILNKNQHVLLSKYPLKAAQPNEIRILEIQFAIDLIETNMWGHRSFNRYFDRIIEPHLKAILEPIVKKSTEEPSEQDYLQARKKIPRKELVSSLYEAMFKEINTA